MEEQFWQSRWAAGQTAFHEEAPNPFLTRHLPSLDLQPEAHIFVPLCGASVDLNWLIAQGFMVSGIEFNRGAIDQVFERMSVTPEITEANGLTRLHAGPLTLWQGDFFALNASDLGPISAVYDRAALVALPKDMRANYAQHLSQITANAQKLLVSFDYDQTQTDGPPFSVARAEIHALHSETHKIEQLESTPISGRLATRCSGFEQTWHLTPLSGN